MNTNKDLHCVLYISSMEVEYSKDDIKSMLKLFQERNKTNNISGLMLYYERNIIQYIEGSKQDVYKLYNNIKNDIRHYNIIKMVDESISSRNFIDWDMGFKELSYDEFIRFSVDKLNFDNNKIKVFFEQFIESFAKF